MKVQDPGPRALLVGIDDYTASVAPDETPARAGRPTGRRVWHDLEGAVNDVQAMREMLIARFGFDGARIRLLVNGQATRQAILAALEEHLVAHSRPRQELFFFYSGHGSQVRNSKSREPDKKDETLVPADSRLGVPDIRDKELCRLFNRVLDLGGRLTVVLDSCHSGSAARGLPGPARPRCLPADPVDVADPSDPGPWPEERGALLLQATQDFDLAWESWDETGKAYGSFTLALLRALRTAGVEEAAEDLFLRVRALLRAGDRLQEPVLAGDEERRRSPLFGPRQDHRSGRTVVAVEEVRPDGTLRLQGGWANGLTPRSKLSKVGGQESPGVEVEITSVMDLGSSEARLLRQGPPENACELTPGDLLGLEEWAVPHARPLKVWLPVTRQGSQDLVRFAQRSRDLVARMGLGWIRDPVAESPAWVLAWEGESWRLTGPGSRARDLGPEPNPRSLRRALRELTATDMGGGFFLHLPVAQELADRLELGAGTRHDAAEITADPRQADYFLVGRLGGDETEYAWLRPNAEAADQVRSSLPLRTRWESAAGSRTAPSERLEDSLLRLAKIRAWLTLDSPHPGPFPYHLELKSSAPRATYKSGGRLWHGQTYGLVLRRPPDPVPTHIEARYVYAFLIDSSGRSTLLFPRAGQGSVENRFPLDDQAEPYPVEIALGPQPLLEVGPPFGVDTYVFLTSVEALPNPHVVECAGVRRRGPRGQTALEELLARCGSTRRSPHPVVAPMNWSIERLFFESLPRPQQGVAS